jgi:hypothetical protein
MSCTAADQREFPQLQKVVVDADAFKYVAERRGVHSPPNTLFERRARGYEAASVSYSRLRRLGHLDRAPRASRSAAVCQEGFFGMCCHAFQPCTLDLKIDEGKNTANCAVTRAAVATIGRNTFPGATMARDLRGGVRRAPLTADEMLKGYAGKAR